LAIPNSDTEELRELKTQCGDAVRALIQRMLTETDYRPTRFIQMVADRGPVGAVRALLAVDLGPGVFHEGLTRLWQLGRLDLSMERLVAYDRRWEQVFTDRERQSAKRRLDELRYVE
jgi:hypothetical protein